VPVEGRDRRRWPSLQRVVRDFERGPSEQAPAKRHSALGRLTALTCRNASLACPWTANPGEKTSLFAALLTSGVGASASLVGLTLTTFVLGLGLGQLLGGPISDQRGRRVPMIGGALICTLGAVGCALAPALAADATHLAGAASSVQGVVQAIAMATAAPSS
jgi:MFS family permease